MTRNRLDVELVRRHLARSREQAQDLIASGQVIVDGMVATKSASQVSADASIKVSVSAEDEFVSRGAHKLIGALDAFNIDVTEKVALDAGASTGGFTDVLLRRGIAQVYCVDVGYGQLAWKIAQDPKVTVLDRTNVRHLTAEQLGIQVDLIVADLSFISLATVLPALASVLKPDGQALLMVKPQFEVGKEALGSGGVVESPALRIESVNKIALSAFDLGLGTAGVVASPLPGPSGNVEYFLWLRPGAAAPELSDIQRAVAEGPS
ncbi:MAG: TlyA family RNA methyltransferase [Actinomycetales bacterium]|nr:TlyA family RNA methyltransferase [Actinomycetales bacterium]